MGLVIWVNRYNSSIIPCISIQTSSPPCLHLCSGDRWQRERDGAVCRRRRIPPWQRHPLSPFLKSLIPAAHRIKSRIIPDPHYRPITFAFNLLFLFLFVHMPVHISPHQSSFNQRCIRSYDFSWELPSIICILCIITPLAQFRPLSFYSGGAAGLAERHVYISWPYSHQYGLLYC